LALGLPEAFPWLDPSLSPDATHAADHGALASDGQDEKRIKSLNIELRFNVVYGKAMDHYTIGQLARAADIPTSTVRYYERRGLLRPDSRSKGNYRVYGEAALERLLFVRAAQAAGFTLGDIDALLDFRDGDSAPYKEVRDLIAVRLDQVVEQIKHLKVVDRVLREWMKVCHESERSGCCGVLEGLQAPREKKCKKTGECS